MARSQLNLKGKPKAKPQRKTKSEQYMVNLKYLGEEPKNVDGTVALARAFNWYNNMAEYDEARQYLKDYFKDDKDLLKLINKIPDKRLPLTSAWLCRIASNSNKKIAVDQIDRVRSSITGAALFVTSEDDEKPIEAKTKPSIQDRIRERGYDIIGDIETMLDKNEIDLYSWLQRDNTPAMYTTKIVDYYKPILDEMKLASAGKIDGYQSYTKKWLRDRVATLEKIIDDAQRYGGNVKKAKAPRKKKAPTTEKILKNFVYQKESNEYKLQSIDPSKIIGAQELWVFNTRYKTLTVLRARGPNGLNIHRTTIDGHDIDASMTKNIGRTAEDTIKRVLSGGKLVLRKLMDEIKTKPGTLAERINENTILLRVV